MVLYKMSTEYTLPKTLSEITRIIIDEASLLTEAALYCIMLRFQHV